MTPQLTCAQVADRLADYLEPEMMSDAERLALDTHLAGCTECWSLVQDLRGITAAAAALPVHAPSRDLWQGIAERIETPVVELPTRTTGEHAVVRRWSPRRALLAASVLVAVTAGVTYTITARTLAPAAGGLASAATNGTSEVSRNVPNSATGTPDVRLAATKRASAEETFDREIGSLRRIVEQRRGDLDSTTVKTLEKNLKLIDQAIAESKAALASDPASSFLMDRLNRAYDSKLQLLRGVATLPARGD